MSHVIIDSQKLEEWCDEVRARVLTSRDAKWEALAEQLAHAYNHSFVRRFFHLPLQSSRVFLEQLKSGEVDIDFSVMAVLNHGSRAEAVATALSTAAKIADRVMVSIEDIELLQEWTPRAVVALAPVMPAGFAAEES